MFFHVRASFLQLKDVIRSGTLLYGVPIRISVAILEITHNRNSTLAVCRIKWADDELG